MRTARTCARTSSTARDPAACSCSTSAPDSERWRCNAGEQHRPGLPLPLPRTQRAEAERVVAGVCAGLARALDVDATFVRLTFALLAFAGGAGFAAYVGAWALLPAPG